jgi:hypothetical protein
MCMAHRHSTEDKNHPCHSLRGHGLKIRTQNGLKWLFLLVFKFRWGHPQMDFWFEGHIRCGWTIGLQMWTKTTLVTHRGAMVSKSGLNIAWNGCFYQDFFCLEFGFSNHGPAVSGRDGCWSHLDAHDPCASNVTLKSKIHPWMASAEFKYLLAHLFLPGIWIFKP